MSEQTLSGLKIVEYGSFISAAYCAKMMADLGAEIIKIEEPGTGDEARRHGPFPGDIPHPEKSGLFLYLNNNKLGVTLDPRTTTGRRLFKQLMEQTDVLVENHQPKEMAELGLDYDTLSQVNPRLVMTSITPFGQTGPYKDYKGYAINAAALGGINRVVGEPGRMPLAPPISQGHFQSGAMGAVATYSALLAREVTGRGQHADVAEADVWAAVHNGQVVHSYVFHGKRRMRGGHRAAALYPYCILPCKDGYIFLVAIQGFQWKRFLEVMGMPDWVNDPRFTDRRDMGLNHPDELDALVETWLLDHTKQEIFELCLKASIPFAPVRNIAEVVNEPHLREREYFLNVSHPVAGDFQYPGAPYKLSQTPCQMRSPAPTLGQHNDLIYHQRLGLSREELATLRRGGII